MPAGFFSSLGRFGTCEIGSLQKVLWLKLADESLQIDIQLILWQSVILFLKSTKGLIKVLHVAKVGFRKYTS